MKKQLYFSIISKKITKIIVLCTFLIFYIPLHAQDTIVTNIDSTTVSIGDTIVFPIRVVNFVDVAEISHKLNYCPVVLKYYGYQNLHSILHGLFFINDIGGSIMAWWANTTGAATLPDGILYELIFIYNGGICCLEWDQSPGYCEYADSSATIIPAIWKNKCIGSVGILPITSVKHQVDIFPNPSTGKFKIQISNPESFRYKSVVEMQIINIHGQEIFSENLVVNSAMFNRELDLSDLPKGVYFINFRDEKSIISKKLLIN